MVRIIDSGQSVSVDDMATEARVHAARPVVLAGAVDGAGLSDDKPELLPVTAA